MSIFSANDDGVLDLVQEYAASTGSFDRGSIAIRIADKLAASYATEDLAPEIFPGTHADLSCLSIHPKDNQS